MDALTGRTIRWVFDDGPMSGVPIEHDFSADGSVTWRFADGEHKGASKRENAYGVAKVIANTLVVSYLAASGHTLTVALNLDDRRMFAFGSDNTSWLQMHGRFEFVR
jgi:hypothetical protein